MTHFSAIFFIAVVLNRTWNVSKVCLYFIIKFTAKFSLTDTKKSEGEKHHSNPISYCYGLNVCMPLTPNAYVEILISKDDGIRRWGLWEVLWP